MWSGLAAFAASSSSGKVSINGAGVFLSLKTAVIKPERKRREQGVSESQHPQRAGLPPPRPRTHWARWWPLSRLSGAGCSWWACWNRRQTSWVGRPKTLMQKKNLIIQRYAGRLLPQTSPLRQPYRKITCAEMEGFPAASPAGSWLRTSPSPLSKPPSLTVGDSPNRAQVFKVCRGLASHYVSNIFHVKSKTWAELRSSHSLRLTGPQYLITTPIQPVP